MAEENTRLSILTGIKNLHALIKSGHLREDLMNVHALLDIIIKIAESHHPDFVDELEWCQRVIKKALSLTQ